VGEGEPIPEAKSIAVEREGSASHEAATKRGPTKARGPKGRPGKAAATKGWPGKAAATTKAAAKSRRTQSRGARGNRCNGKTNHYLAHYDATPFVRRRTPAFR
jgi:hypothetical protein